jgi:hypothetical protein
MPGLKYTYDSWSFQVGAKALKDELEVCKLEFLDRFVPLSRTLLLSMKYDLSSA